MLQSIDVRQIQQEHYHLAGALRRWEADASPAMAHALQATVAQTQQHLDAWIRAGAYEDVQMRLLRDQVAHALAVLDLPRPHRGDTL